MSVTQKPALYLVEIQVTYPRTFTETQGSLTTKFPADQVSWYYFKSGSTARDLLAVVTRDSDLVSDSSLIYLETSANAFVLVSPDNTVCSGDRYLVDPVVNGRQSKAQMRRRK